MRKRLRFIFFIAVLTGSGIVAFQSYWLYHAYRISQDNFYKTALADLQTSVDRYQLQQAGQFPPTAGGNKVSLMLVPGPIKNNSVIKTNSSVAVTHNNMQKVQLIMAHLMSQVANKPVNLKLLENDYRNELKKSQLGLPFSLSIIKTTAGLPDRSVIGLLGLADNSLIVKASFKSDGYFLLWQNALPLCISLLLILLTSGCLWYMWYIINRQIALDDLKNDFINNMTHELRTPVAVLRSTHEALDKFGEVADPEKTLRYLRINQKTLDKLETNIDRILDITQYERGNKVVKPEVIELKELLTAVIAAFHLNESGDIALDDQLSRSTVKTDRYMLETIVSNLVDNALKYSGENALVTLKISDADNCWQLQVNDNGNGIDEKYLPFIFDKFYRVPTGNLHDIKGFGLGLNYVKELTQLLHGKITVTSKLNTGTIFTLKFPFEWTE